MVLRLIDILTMKKVLKYFEIWIKENNENKLKKTTEKKSVNWSKI